MNKWMKPAIVVCLILSALRVSLSQEDRSGDAFYNGSQDGFRDLIRNENTIGDVEPDPHPAYRPDHLIRNENTIGDRRRQSDESSGADKYPDPAVRGFDSSASEDGIFEAERAATPEAERQIQFRIAIRKLRSPDSTEKEREVARGRVTAGLREQFDADLSGREQKLQQLEQQLSQLKAHVERRKAARDKLVELQIQLIENEALGLAFPEAWQIHAGPASHTDTRLMTDDFPPLVDGTSGAKMQGHQKPGSSK